MRSGWLAAFVLDEAALFGEAAHAFAVVLGGEQSGHMTSVGFDLYTKLLAKSFVMKDHKRLRLAPGVVFSDFVQHVQPGLVCDVAESFFTVANPAAKPGLLRTIRRTMRARGIGTLAALRSAIATIRVFR